jgi:SNF family Na+-dependent transporter
LKHGYLDQYDFWIGTVGLVVFSLFETVIFTWLYKGDFWEEITRGGDIKLPRIFYHITKYVVPIFLIILLISWVYQDLTDPESKILLSGVSEEKLPFLWFARLTMIAIIIFIAVLVKAAWEKKRKEAE